MRIAVRYGELRIEGGRIVGEDAGTTLVRRLLRVFPEAVVVGPGPRLGDGFEVVPLRRLAPGTVVVNMDVIDSVCVWRALREDHGSPRIMNFVWWNVSQYTHRVEQAALGLACALFPTFANSERTANEVREVVAAQTPPHLAEQSRVAWVNLGIRLERVQERAEPDVPVVLYPAIYLSDRKRPELFWDVVQRVHRRTPIRVEARLHSTHLSSERAMRMSRHDWTWVGPLTAREDYWEALSRTTAFLATATEESYGLEYIEALVAGAVGVFPDRAWARAILPEGYPFCYRTPEEAEELLHRAVTDTAACRRELDAAAGGDFVGWLRERHDDDHFERAIAAHVHQWFG